ncbi:MAG: hypothetical protein K940chlam3_01644 [Chlamydiae bacterium]|nr:hypothetical protein [Chlamydiota bacterium]
MGVSEKARRFLAQIITNVVLKFNREDREDREDARRNRLMSSYLI